MLERLAAPTAYPVSLATAKEWTRETTNASDAVLTRLTKAAVQVVERVTHLAVVYRPVREQYDYFLPYFELSGCPVLGVKSITYLDSAGVQQTLAPASYIVDKTKMAARITPQYAQYFPPTRVIMNSMQVTYDIGILVPVVSVDPATERINAPGHNKVAGDIVQLSTDGAAGAAIPGLTLGLAYYVVNVVGDTFQVSLTPNGAAVDITGAVVATVFIGMLEDDIVLAMQLMIDSWHRNRSDVSPNQVFEMPSVGGAMALLAPYMARGFQ